MPRAALIHAGGRRRLLLPDRERAAVLGDIDGHVLHTRAAFVVERGPLHLEVRTGERRRGQRGRRRDRVDRVGELERVLRRRVVEEHARLRVDLRTRRGGGLRRDGERHKARACPVERIWRQQALARIVDHFARLRIDRLEEPRRGARRVVERGAHAQHVAFRRGEIEVAGERAALSGDVDGNVAELDVAERERARIEIGIKLAEHADFRDGGTRCRRILERDGVRQRGADGDELFRA